MTNIQDIAKEICAILKIDNGQIQKIINEKLTTDEQIINNNDLLNKITLLIQSDTDIKNFQKKIKDTDVLESFNKLKTELGKLQILTLIKQLEKSKNCDDILNSLFEVLNNKITSVNEILKISLTQIGGNVNFYKKFLKYKIKNQKIMYLLDLDK